MAPPNSRMSRAASSHILGSRRRAGSETSAIQRETSQQRRRQRGEEQRGNQHQCQRGHAAGKWGEHQHTAQELEGRQTSSANGVIYRGRKDCECGDAIRELQRIAKLIQRRINEYCGKDQTYRDYLVAYYACVLVSSLSPFR